MGATPGKFELTTFQKRKLLHEFRTFYDLNKDGNLSWQDFTMARENICKMSGWKIGTERYMHAHELFSDIWKHLQETADENVDGIIDEEEWLVMWTNIEQHKVNKLQNGKTEKPDQEPEIPEWLEKYIQYKFNLLDRTGNGNVDVDEYEYVMSMFNIPAKDCRSAFTLFSQNGSKRVDLLYFRELCIEYYRSSDPEALGNFINGKMVFDDELDTKDNAEQC